tara:strand:- start:494 stop:2251 length:1758 start_codon:yes stop_codon:yes gene_type:complete
MTTPLSLLEFSAEKKHFPALNVLCCEPNDQGIRRYTWADFYHRQNSWQQHLQQSLPKYDVRVALYHASAFEFACALSALWRLGLSAIIPGNNDASTLQQLSQHCDYFAGEFPCDENIFTPATNDYRELPCTKQCASNGEALVIFTSGSSGQPLPISKSFAQLDSEITALEQLWGKTLTGVTISGTVSHQHIYGLLFRVLWPLSCGRVFVDRNRDFTEALLVDSRQCSSTAFIMSPAHLSRLPANLDRSVFRQSCQAVFSSGAPLSQSSALEAETLFGIAPTEVYGSSEAGGIAWRQQLRNHYWQTLPRVSIKTQVHDDELILCINSPHLPDNNWFVSADRCLELSSEGFLLGKRTDRIRKIGGKRISLTTIEEQLSDHPWVNQVRVITLEDRGNRSAALVVLTSAGNNRLINDGKYSVNQVLAKHLQGRADHIAIPRYWRYWDSIPRNSLGKTTQTEIASLFSQEQKPQEPIVTNTLIDEYCAELTLFIPHNLSWFDGHFPGRPILPGVVQTHWAKLYGQRNFGQLGSFKQLEVIKFQHVITPGKNIVLTLSWNPDKSKLTFAYQIGEQRISSGRIAFQAKTSQD